MVRGAYAILVDQPMTSVVIGHGREPAVCHRHSVHRADPFGQRHRSGARRRTCARRRVDHGFDNAYLQSWNLNVQRELTGTLAVMAGYFGSKGTHLILSAQHQSAGLDGVRPFPRSPNRARSCQARRSATSRRSESTGQFELQRSLAVGEQATRAGPAVQRFLHLVEVAGLQFVQLAGRRCAEQL